MKSSRQKTNLTRGRSMVEMLGVLGIMALITALGIIAYTQAMKMFNMDKFKNELTSIRIHIQTKFQGSDFAKLDSMTTKERFQKYLIDTGVFKKNITPLGADSYYSFSTSSYKGYWPILVFGLEQDVCEDTLLNFENPTGYNYCRKEDDGKYRLTIYFER